MPNGPSLHTPPDAYTTPGLGWLPDFPDHRDYGLDQPTVAPLLSRPLAVSEDETTDAGALRADLPTKVSLRSSFQPIKDQGNLGSCTAFAAVGLVEYMERRAFGKHLNASELFVYKTTRRLLGWTGDTGAFLRSAMGSLVYFGAPPSSVWPYVVADFEREPDAFVYSYGQSYQSLKYVRHDKTPDRAATTASLKRSIAAGIPAMGGFTVYNSISQASASGKIPFPSSSDRVAGGHAVGFIGYDDSMPITHTGTGVTTTGAWEIRNSWGTSWGVSGYGWLPYEYTVRGLAVDFWSVISQEYVDSGQFGLA